MKQLAGIAVAAIALSGCAWSYSAHRDLTYADLREHSDELIGQPVTVFAATERRLDGRKEIDLWLSAAVRAHAFGPERANHCIRAVDQTGQLAALKQWAIVRVRGTIRRDPIAELRAMECPSPLVLAVASVQVLPDY